MFPRDSSSRRIRPAVLPIAWALACLTGTALGQTGTHALDGPVEILWDEAFGYTPGASDDVARALALDEIGDVLYAIDGASGGTWGIHARAMRASTGQVLWQVDYAIPGYQPVGIARAQLTPDRTRLTFALPGVTFDWVWMIEIPHHLFGVLDTGTGALEWFLLEDGNFQTLGISPDGQTLYRAAEGELHAHAATTGSEIWPAVPLVDANWPSWMHVPAAGSPLLLGDMQYSLVQSLPWLPPTYQSFPAVTAYASDGSHLWTKHYDTAQPFTPETQGTNGHASLASDGAMLYVGGSLNPPSPSFVVNTPFLRAYAADTGTSLWTRLVAVTEDSYVAGTAIGPCGSPLYAFVRPRFPTLGAVWDYTLHAIDTADGSDLWSVTLEAGLATETEFLVDFELSADGRVLLSTFRTNLPDEMLTVASSAANGQELWEARHVSAGGWASPYDMVVSSDGRTVHVGGRSQSGAAGLPNGRIIAYRSADPGFRGDVDSISLSAGGVQTLLLDGGHCLGGAVYVVVGSVSGTSPGISLFGGFALPLNPDNYFGLTLQQPNTPPLSASLGLLDGSGSATASFSIPAGAVPQLAGQHFDHAWAALDAGTGFLLYTSEAVGVDLLP